MSFHDCGTWQRYPKPAFEKAAQCGGCNGSFKKEFENGKSTNFCSYPQQAGMQPAYNLFWGEPAAAATIRAEPGCAKMSYADMISIVGYVAVVQAGGTARGGCGWYPGRPDADGYDDTNMLPSETFDAGKMMTHWARYDMTEAQQVFGLKHAETIVTLSGAHTVGHSQVHKSSPTSLGTCICHCMSMYSFMY